MYPVVNTNNFEELVLNARGMVLVNVWAYWCVDCLQMSATMRKLRNLLDEQDTIVQIDWDQQKMLANELKAYGIPTLLIFASGDEITRYYGIVDKDDLMTTIMKVKNNNFK